MLELLGLPHVVFPITTNKSQSLIYVWWVLTL
jgi:hypothetical protein